MDRNRLEQEALLQLNRGKPEGALKAYTEILKLEPKDRRVRQKVGELYLKLGRTADAEKHLKEVADGLAKEGNPRAAIPIYKQLLGIRKDDPALLLDLAECYYATDYINEARPLYEQVQKAYTDQQRPLDAAAAARRLAAIHAGEPMYQLKLAELLESGGNGAEAFRIYQGVVAEYRRRGRMEDMGRVAGQALRIRPDDLGLLLDAAAAWVEAGDHKRALQHLQTAFNADPKEPRTLDLLGRALEGVGQIEKAWKVLLELARVAADRAEIQQEVDALRRAVRLVPQDVDLRRRLTDAELRLSRLEHRVTLLHLAQPDSEDLLRPTVQSEVYVRYGFPDRAEKVLLQALDTAPDALCLIAAMAEVQVALNRPMEALRWLERLVPRAGEEAGAVLDRIAALRGTPRGDARKPEPAPTAPTSAVSAAPRSTSSSRSVPPPERVFTAPRSVPPPEIPRYTPPADLGPIDIEASLIDDVADPPAAPPVVRAPAAPPPVAPVAPASVIAPRRSESPEERGDRLFAAGDAEGALQAWRLALADDPFNDALLDKIRKVRPPEEPTISGFTDDFTSMMDDEPIPELEAIPMEEVTDPLAEARSLIELGMYQDALPLVQEDTSLEGRILLAMSLRGLGDVATSLEILRMAINKASMEDPSYPDALFELAGIYIATGQHRSAKQLLAELEEEHPYYREKEVQNRMRALSRSMG